MSLIARIQEWFKREVSAMPDGLLKRFYSRLSVRTILVFGIFYVAVIAFVEIAEEMREQDTLPFDNWVLQHVHSYFGSPFLDSIMPKLTDIGGTVGIIVLTALISAAFYYKKQYRRMYIVLAGVGGAVILSQLLKTVFMRVRPNLWEQLVVENSFSFPSSHAMASSALAFSLIVALWYTRWRWHAIIGGALYIWLVGFSRLYLGVHYPTDVVAGWTVSLAWVLAVWVLFRGTKRAMKKLHDRSK